VSHTGVFGHHVPTAARYEGTSRVTGQAAGPGWPSAAPPRVHQGLAWELEDIAQLPALRTEVRRFAIRHALGNDRDSADLRDRLVLALDEMASNALRHGGGRVRASLGVADECYLIEVSDSAPGAPPVPAVNRDPSEGGLGLYLIAELATDHGWYATDDAKHVWALLPRG
jgi:anti-sigma regulatory factor (Ser/Thr protein kinase)